MAESSPKSAVIISKLQSSDFSNIDVLFSDYLSSFTSLPNPPPPTLIRSLAKSFLSFLNQSLSLLPKILLSRPPPEADHSSKLLSSYDLSLKCLESISSQLSCKPYNMQLNRMYYMRCLEWCGKRKEAEKQGFRILEEVKEFKQAGVACKKKDRWAKKNKYVAEVDEEADDKELIALVVETVVGIAKCVCLRRSDDCDDYKRVIVLVEEVRPWFRLLEASVEERLHRVLLLYLDNCIQYLVGKLTCFDGKLVMALYSTTFSEYSISSSRDQLFKLARRICSSLLFQQNTSSSHMVNMLQCVLTSIVNECKAGSNDYASRLVDLVSYCVNLCLEQRADTCFSVAECLEEISAEFCQEMSCYSLILRLFAIRLRFVDCTAQDGVSQTSSRKLEEFKISSFLEEDTRLLQLAALVGSLRYLLQSCGIYSDTSFSGKANMTVPILSHMEFAFRSSEDNMTNNSSLVLCLFDALKFLCETLAEIVNSRKFEILATEGAITFSSKLDAVLDALLMCGDVFIHLRSCMLEEEYREFSEKNKFVVNVAVAAFTISFRIQPNAKPSVKLIQHLMSSGCVKPQRLKCLFASLYKVGLTLYRSTQLTKALLALKLSCRASWVCVSLLSQLFVKNSEGLSDAFLVETASEACRISAYYIDVHHQCTNDKVHKEIVEILQSWSFAVNLFKNLPRPVALVKQWVKIACNRSTVISIEDTAATLYCLLLSSSREVSRDSVGILLDQELLAYERMKTSYPEFCNRMQMKIIDILLQNVYVTCESLLLRSRTFIMKGKTLRMHGVEDLEDCILCFSEAITLLKDACGKSSSPSCEVCHQLAISYCLRALATQEASPNSKLIFEDIQSAVIIWLSISVNDMQIEECGLVSNNTIFLLYHIMDLVSLKGHTKFLKDIYNLIFTLFKWKNIPMEKYIPLLWEYRRLNHALCASPVNESFLVSLEEACGATSKSIEYWLGCLSGSQQLLLGFEQNFSYLFSISSKDSHYQGGSFRLNITAHDVEEAALLLISDDHVPSKSIFLAGNLYHDLAERFLLNGQLIEGLTYAKEAHRLCNKLFKENFSFSAEKQSRKHDKSKKTAECCSDDLQDFRLVATKVWSYDDASFSLETYSLSPWNVLRCYLESFLQVGVIHELLGNSTEAEMFLVWGRNLSRSQGLPLFSIAFSTVLGKLYRNRRHWDLAESELGSAKRVLFNIIKDTCCWKCRLMFEINVEQQLGDMFRRQLNDRSGSCSSVSSSNAKNVYKSAVEKLKISDWKNLVSCPEDVRTTKNCHFAAAQFDINETTKVSMEVKRSRRTKKAANNLSQEQQSVPEHNLRITRSRSRSCKNKTVNLSGNLQDGLVTTSDVCKIPSVLDPLSTKISMLQIENSAVDLGCDITHSPSKIRCWNSVSMEVLESASIYNFIFLKWEFVRRRLLVQLLLGLGKCLEACGQVHETHEVYLESIAVLFQRNLFYDTDYSLKENFVDLIGKELPGDVLAMERATVLYYICRFSLKSYGSGGTRVSCCKLSQVDAPIMVSWLLVAFVLCRDVPYLLQKVSRQLALMYVLSASSENFSFHSLLSKTLSHSHCASFFHQASIGIQINHQLLSSMVSKYDSENLFNSKVHAGFTPNGSDTWNMIRLVPGSLQELDNFIANFFHGLPCATVVCFSLLGGSKATLLRELLHYPSSVHAWILLSRLNSTSQPVVVLLPLNSALKDDTSNSIVRKLFEENEGDNTWHCPWGSMIVDYAAPVFRELLKQNFITSSNLVDTKSNRLLWWTQRKELDQRFCKFLSDLEELWLGPWKYLLLGAWPDCSQLDSIEKKLMRDLRRKCKLNVNQSLLRILLRGAIYACHKGSPLEGPLQTGCFVGRVRNSEEQHKTPADIPVEAGSLSNICLELVLEAANRVEKDKVSHTEPTILVLDWEIQMLPFENMPILRNEEVYRMPSVGSITATLNRSRHHLQQAGGIVADFPLIDPLDAYYLLNPGGDLYNTQLQFESWFQDKKFEGKVGGAPTTEELASALKDHDLFIYLGHGSGSQYISGNKIQKLDYCAATFLMGCSSGSLSLNGCYAPRGIPLSYLLAGSPLIVANLWEVTDKDIDRFGRAMLDSWLRERAASSSDCSERPKIGSFMGQAREACTLPFLIGAAPVCYGVPTGIWKKKDS